MEVEMMQFQVYHNWVVKPNISHDGVVASYSD